MPWARQPEISFLVSGQDLRLLLEENGFQIVTFSNATPPALGWMRDRAAALSGDRPPSGLGFHLLLGADAEAIFANQVRNLEEDRIRLVQVIAEAR